MIKVFIGEIATGNGNWIDLPYYDNEELEILLQDAGVNTAREYMIYDIDNYTGIDLDHFGLMYPDLAGINELAKFLESLNSREIEDLQRLIDYHGYEDGMEIFKREEYCIMNFNNKYALRNGLLDIFSDLDLDDPIVDYIDADKYIRDNTEYYNETKGYAIVYS